MSSPINVRLEDKTAYQTNEHIAVGAEYEAIGKMIHEALGESRIAHAIQTEEHKWESNPDIEKVKKTANEFLDKIFQEYTKERLLRFSMFLLSKLFFSLNLILTILLITLFLVLNKVVAYTDIAIWIIISVLLILTIFLLIEQAKNKIYNNNEIKLQ